MTGLLPTPELDRPAPLRWVAEHLGQIIVDEVRGSDIRGGQQAADAALQGFDVAGYAHRRNQAWPPADRGASGLSPYIRHGLLSLPRVWQHVAGGPSSDAAKFRDELRWQEYARHLYARLGSVTGHSLRYFVQERGGALDPGLEQARCLDVTWSELAERGWITNQQRMWVASHWSVREDRGWREGEDLLFRQLLDGSRAANRIGWQWTVGALTGKAYGFSRWQVEKRAPSLCRECPLSRACPIEEWPPERTSGPDLLADPRIRRDPDLSATTGPREVQREGEPEVVWLTAESLGDGDPALAAHPDLPAVFVFDLPLLRSLRLSSTRLVFLAETLADLAKRRDLSVYLGDPVEVLGGRPLATTFAPVPGWRHRATRLDLAAVHPWPWLVPPHDGPVGSFTAWANRSGKTSPGSRGSSGKGSTGRVGRARGPG